ncbi:hypothetical protein Poli38472_005937 [Pythium oligandrum]|uniref:glucan endo-1,3-beta-D-glucosidase n=1 Tax=Pythium oligandrum TaxID=41045 RepID=A0A8K1CRY1_PYTOL|nr:hypothetical protein Poli38472_005937 [Pythium oligandrum]|eukprot:TMW68469.1 hypothetical protein Poli38472_005937 [Pythium oligandrum]
MQSNAHPHGLASFMFSVFLLLYSIYSCEALVQDESLPAFDLQPWREEAMAHEESAKYEAAALSNVIPGACYSPFHNAEYPLFGGSASGLNAAMYADFALMKNYVSVVRTYYSSYYGIPVTPAAAASGVKLYLGVFMTDENWYGGQVDDAINAVKQYPDTIVAILVGNENIAPVGPYSPQDVAKRVAAVKQRLRDIGRGDVPVGTVQRATDWLDSPRRNDMLALAAACDIVGVNIYPFFDNNYDAAYPLVILNGVWDLMLQVYPESKLRLTEVGYPTGGGAPSYAPRNIPSTANAQRFYNAFINWNPSRGGGEAFWFMFFDRRPDDNSMQAELEKYFGFFTYDRKSKAPDFPARLTAINQAAAQVTVSTPTPTPAPKPAPVPTTTVPRTTTPPPKTVPRTTTPSPTTVRPTSTPSPAPVVTTVSVSSSSGSVGANVCRVRKVFYG